VVRDPRRQDIGREGFWFLNVVRLAQVQQKLGLTVDHFGDAIEVPAQCGAQPLRHGSEASVVVAALDTDVVLGPGLREQPLKACDVLVREAKLRGVLPHVIGRGPVEWLALAVFVGQPGRRGWHFLLSSGHLKYFARPNSTLLDVFFFQLCKTELDFFG
jgi:hypothetical protein